MTTIRVAQIMVQTQTGFHHCVIDDKWIISYLRFVNFNVN